ncbi:ribonuclease kappa-A [Drosophila ficusphila]|uniref:ribonuclease kappa-A n=1 Tax=Drosophila ficusphila TaxID=30025 RepID=UPI0007E800DD|nr:ribonuclease kappa-A [Drosophila ficusphila]
MWWLYSGSNPFRFRFRFRFRSRLKLGTCCGQSNTRLHCRTKFRIETYRIDVKMVCGRKCCFFCLFMSFWGFLMLNLLGICFYLRSLMLLNDLQLPQDFNSPESFKEYTEVAYQEVSIRCFIAAVIYLGFVFVSIIAIRRDNKRRKRLYKRQNMRHPR